jgi:glycosyltransferase involved in cell wall biosynthesis
MGFLYGGARSRLIAGRSTRTDGGKARMKVGLVIYGPLATTSGGYLYDRMLVEHLRSRGEQVEVISLESVSLWRGLVGGPSYDLSSEYDVLLQDELCHPSLLRFNRRAHQQPIVSIVHNLHADLSGWASPLYRPFERLYLGSVDAFIFNSEATRTSVTKLVGSDRPELVATPGGDRLGQMTEDAITARAFQRGPLRLIFLGNVVRSKGLGTILEALGSFREGSFRLDVVGSYDVEPRYATAMRRRAGRFGSSVQFHGILDGTALSRILSQAHALVLPSNYEGFGIAYLEGMAHGLVAVGTTAGAVPDLVSDGVDGFLIHPRDSRELRDRLLRLAYDRRLVCRMGISALEKYRSMPAWKTSMERIRRFLLSLSRPARGSHAERQGQSARQDRS